MSVSTVPLTSVMVLAPFEKAPPTMPISAELAVTDTSRNIGSDAGKACETDTVSDEPFTEITAERTTDAVPLEPELGVT